MHGSIGLESNLGAGTKATFWLPFNKAPYGYEDTSIIDYNQVSDRLRSEASLSWSNDQGNAALTYPDASRTELTGSRNNSETGATKNPTPADTLSVIRTADNSVTEDRKKIHIMVVEDNQVNQQIAIKTIQKLGFSVSAVWNGQEALDYLLKSPSDSHPQPDVILMDCQMPILDGYKTTETIRTQAPFKNISRIRKIPIVAMTASAIQGDREKAERSGMDDYLAKPVNRSLLERMILKWTVHRKNTQSKLREQEDSSSQEPTPIADEESSQNSPPHPGPPQRALSHSEIERELGEITYETSTKIDKATKSVDEHEKARQQQEEKASSLRDAKIISFSDDNRMHVRSAEREGQKAGGRVFDDSITKNTHALTKANMDMLVEQHQHQQHQQHPVPQNPLVEAAQSLPPAIRMQFLRARSHDSVVVPNPSNTDEVDPPNEAGQSI